MLLRIDEVEIEANDCLLREGKFIGVAWWLLFVYFLRRGEELSTNVLENSHQVIWSKECKTYSSEYRSVSSLFWQCQIRPRVWNATFLNLNKNYGNFYHQSYFSGTNVPHTSYVKVT